MSTNLNIRLKPRMLVRPEQETDRAAVYALNSSAFESSAEANLVDKLRRDAEPYVSLVGETEGKVVGHIMFTPVIVSNHPLLKVMGLAPLAVASTYRGQGVGTALVRAGLERSAHVAFGAVVVLGHPDYYSRFGFRPGASYGLACEYAVPTEAFMAAELRPNYLAGVSGTVSYHVAFAGV